jgi:hypothetical protein
MALFQDDDPSTGSGDGGTLGTPTTDNVEDVPSNDEDSLVVSGGGVADTSQADRDASSRPGPRAEDPAGGGRLRTPNVAIGLVVFAAFVLLMFLLA